MSSQEEDGRSLDKGSENSDVDLMKPKLSYSREFLLSLSNLDSCKKLPCGFDEKVIREFEDGLLILPDRPRIPGNLPFQGFRRTEHSASPPTRGDASNYPRGNFGKWESRSSLRSDRDSDSQSDRDSDSGRRFGPQSRRSWQTLEHDGLLGSGSFSRPSGYAAGVSAPKSRANEQNQPTRSNEPYHPPRPYRAAPHSRRDTDTINDETFGSMECSNEDRVEAERRRRASFETMRKDQHKALQEKQQSNLEKHKGGPVSDLFGMLADSKEEKGLHDMKNLSEISEGVPISSNDSEKPFASHSPASRPLIPPGFKANTLEKSSSLKSVVHTPLSEVDKSVTGKSLVGADPYLAHSINGGLERRLSEEIRVDNGQPVEKPHSALVSGKQENADVPIKTSGMEYKLFIDSHGPLGDNAGLMEDKTASGSNRNYSTSILEKILSSTSLDDGPSNFIEYDSKPEDKWSPKYGQSSKFSQWFFEEEAKAAADVSSSTPKDLLSLIVGGDKANVVSDQVSINNKEEAIPPVLTCEDLEQTILSEYSNVQPVVEDSSTNSDKPITNVDNHATLNLLSMLKKSTDQNDTTVNAVVDVNFPDKSIISREINIPPIFNKPSVEENVKTVPNPGRTVTLETLFGTAFMNELQSVEAPVSVQRGPIGSARVDPVSDHTFSSLIIDEIALQGSNLDFNAQSNHRHHKNVSRSDNWLGFDSSNGVKFQLPEEDNLISVDDARDYRMSTYMPVESSFNHTNRSLNAPINITDELAAFRGAVNNPRGMEGSESMRFPFDPYEKMGPEIYRNNMQVQHSSPRFQPIIPQMPLVRSPLYNHHLETNPARMGSQPKFLGQDPIFTHHSRAHHQIAPNVARPSFHHPNLRVSGFDVPSQHSMVHQAQMAGNHTPHFSGGFPVLHNGNQSSGLYQESNQVRGFPFGPSQPNIAGRGMPMPGNSPDDAFQRLIEMELHANSKQIHPPGPGQNPEMMQGLDMGFRYR